MKNIFIAFGCLVVSLNILAAPSITLKGKLPKSVSKISGRSIFIARKNSLLCKTVTVPIPILIPVAINKTHDIEVDVVIKNGRYKVTLPLEYKGFLRNNFCDYGLLYASLEIIIKRNVSPSDDYYNTEDSAYSTALLVNIIGDSDKKDWPLLENNKSVEFYLDPSTNIFTWYDLVEDRPVFNINKTSGNQTFEYNIIQLQAE